MKKGAVNTMKQKFIWIITLSAFVVAGMLLSSSANAQTGELAVLNADAGIFQVRDTNAEEYSDVSGTVSLNEGTTLRWEANAVGSIDFFNGLDIPVSTTGNSASEVLINRLDTANEQALVSLRQNEGRVTYSLRDGLEANRIVTIESRTGATANLSSGTIEMVEGAVVRSDTALSQLSWLPGSIGDFSVGTFMVDFANQPNCAVQNVPYVEVYNPGSSTSPTRVGLNGNVRFTTLDSRLTTEVVIGNLLLVIDGASTITVCGTTEYALQIRADEVAEPVEIVALDNGDPIVSMLSGASIGFGPGTGNPLQLPSIIVPPGPSPVGASSVEGACTAGQTVVVDSTARIVGDNTNCEDDTEAINPNFSPLTISNEETCSFLLYQSDLTGNVELYRLGETEDDPVSQRNLSQGGLDTVNLLGAISPDYQYVAFSTNRDGNYEIYVASTDGDDLQRITFNERATDINPVWSVDGTTIFYQTNVDGNWDLRSFNVTSGELTVLTRTPFDEIDPSVAPNGNQVLYSSNAPFTNDAGNTVTGLWQSYILDVNTGEFGRLSDGTANDYAPVMSPSGDYVAFLSDRETNTDDTLFISAADGSDIQRISDTNGITLNHVWSPEEDYLTYEFASGNSSNLFGYDVVQDESIQLTTTPEDATSVINSAPSFSCTDPNTVYLSSNVDGDYELYSIPTRPDSPIDVSIDAVQLTNNNNINDVAPLSDPRNSDSGFVFTIPV